MQSLPEDPAWIEVARGADRRGTRHHVLVLQAAGIESGVLQHGRTAVIVVRAGDAARAREELERYGRENAAWPPREAAPAPISQGVHAAIVYGGVLALFFLLQTGERFHVDWTELGRADAALIRGGEWWRAITALSLHADLPHVAGNVVFGGVLAVVLAQSVGLGAAWWSFLASGALGNLANALLQDPTHRSLGASTAVFGALGAQVAYEWMRRGELGYRRFRRLVPVIMGIALLAWLGAGGAYSEDPDSIEGLERVDIGAHALGFLSGAGIGLALGFVPRGRLRWTPARQALIASCAALALALAWIVAILSR